MTSRSETSPNTRMMATQTDFKENVFSLTFMIQLSIVLLILACFAFFQSGSQTCNLENTRKELITIQSGIAEVNSQLEKHKTLVNDVSYLKNEVKERILPNLFHKENFTLVFIVLFMLVIGLVVAVFFLYKRLEEYPAKKTQNLTSNQVLQQVPTNPKLQSTVCIISFDKERQKDHIELIESTHVFKDIGRKLFVVNRHENVLELPHCKVYVMCTEFTERHVIIEEPGLGLGDLHSTTYQAIQKLGGTLIILYTRDPGSRRLLEGERYNKNIYCVTHQPELITLNNDGRFFSVYDELTASQKTDLKHTIMQYVS